VEGATLTLVLALAAGVVGQSVARHLRVPGIVLLLALGVAMGPDGLGWIDPRSLGEGLFSIVQLAVAIILFEGGLNLEISRLVRSQTAIRRLVTWGALLTLVGGTLSAHLLLGWSWLTSALFGSLVVVTGPTVIGPLVSELRLQPRVATVLEAEGVLIDPIGVILAVLVLEVALAPGADSLASGGLALVAQLAFGGLAGIAAGFALGGLLRVRRIVPDGFENIFTLAAVLLLFVGCDLVVAHSGILAVPIAGVVVGNLRTRVDRDLREFKDQITVLLIGVIFVLLAADVRLEEVRMLGTAGASVIVALVLLVRPLNVLLCTAGSDLSVAERGFIAWLAPRGIVAAAIATLTSNALEARGLPGGPELRALVFMTIAGTVALAGFTALPVAALLGVRLPGRDRVGILGVNGLGLRLAAELKRADVPVVFLDSNPQNCRRAEDAGFPVVFGNALQERTLQRARFESVGTAIGMTPNDALNNQFAEVVRDLFGVPNALVALRRAETDAEPGSDPLFLAPHDLERWDVRVRHDDVSVERWIFQGAPEQAQAAAVDSTAPPSVGERFVLLLVQRGSRLRPVARDYAPREGDVASVAIHLPDADEAHALLGAQGWARYAEPPPEGT
jgi:NhaP-type Na+/H+ or K+/H+ antiporter